MRKIGIFWLSIAVVVLAHGFLRCSSDPCSTASSLVVINLVVPLAPEISNFSTSLQTRMETMYRTATMEASSRLMNKSPAKSPAKTTMPKMTCMEPMTVASQFNVTVKTSGDVSCSVSSSWFAQRMNSVRTQVRNRVASESRRPKLFV